MANKGAILHLFGWDRKFVPPFVNFVRNRFDDSEHVFIIYGAIDDIALPMDGSIIYYQSILNNLSELLSQIRRARKIILHGLFSSHLLYALSLHPWILKKTCWVLWGGDLYAYRYRNFNWRNRKNELFRRIIIKRLALLTTTVPGDYELAKEWYKTNAKFKQNLMYQSHLARKSIENSSAFKNKFLIYVQIGNSADPENNHQEIIDALSKLNLENVQIYAPLSYGNVSYGDYIASYGNRILGDRFIPIREMMNFDDYNNYLSNIDIVLLNHRRQQAMGNTIALLSLGKKVYLRSDVTPWHYLKSLNLSVFDILGGINLTTLPLSDASKNMQICNREFTEEKLIADWKVIFECDWDYLGVAHV